MQVTKGTPNPVDLEFRADGTLIAKGNAGVGALLSSDQGAGTRLLWYPALAAFRAGTVPTYYPHVWDLSNIGRDSVAFGLSTTASGIGSTALGQYSTASGFAATAVGYYTTASGYGSTAFADGTSATGSSSTAFGNETTASGDYSTAIGN